MTKAARIAAFVGLCLSLLEAKGYPYFTNYLKRMLSRIPLVS